MSNAADDDPQFDFNFMDIPDTEQKDTGPKAKKVESTKKELQEVLNLEDNVSNGFVRKCVLKYSMPQPKKDNWGAADHLARFHLNIRNINLRSREGVFFATTTQGTTHEEDTGDEERDELSKDEKDDDIPSLKAPEWKTEMLNPRQQVLLEKKSDVFDPTETYWKFRHIIEALKYVELAPDAAAADAIRLADEDADPTTESNTQYDAPSTGPEAFSASGPTSTFDEARYVEASELESELGAIPLGIRHHLLPSSGMPRHLES
ncbi:hypothetical protein Aspvir_008898 [Aspergillus viridinutans]|uniref:Uncharacterized protein n=1 Tax=Aspergillus viridinutans TaxID=75553 RepID=A0A9P3C240_ASPVI|nr:uncharacterized protein Aspvir_008898 [Aspergillus viridinutans]GIK04803.1 hypothetical protein Aspvir_008898 [Aspergillus viridinutans]